MTLPYKRIYVNNNELYVYVLCKSVGLEPSLYRLVHTSQVA
jgi:hypothetical protein